MRDLSRRTAFLLLCVAALLALPAGRTLADEESVWAALKRGGNVILMRHAHVDIGEGMGRHAPGNCGAEVNLSPRGVRQARRIGEAFRARGIAVVEVSSSPYCRCIDTGMHAFGRATAVPYLMPPGVASESQAGGNDERVLEGILKHRGPSNVVMITHTLNIANIVLDSPVMGEFFVVQPKGADLDVIGRIRTSDQ